MSDTKTVSKRETLPAEGQSSPRRTRILLVEGDGFTRLVLLLRLRLAGFAVDFTSNGILGLRKVVSCTPDVLLVDLKLYGLSGIDLVKAARTEPTFGKRPIYVYTRGDRIKRTIGKELARLNITLFDKNTMTREEVVQTLVTRFGVKPVALQSLGDTQSEKGTTAGTSEPVPPEAIDEIIAGVQEQAQLLVKAREPGAQRTAAQELSSRACSLADCAEAAGLPQLARHAKALQTYLEECARQQTGGVGMNWKPAIEAVEILPRLSSPAAQDQNIQRSPAVLVDEVVPSIRALEQGLVKAGLKPVCFQDPTRAREYLLSNRAQLIVLNLPLPDAHGLALRDIRRLQLHEQTPVVFGPEPNTFRPKAEDSPTSGARLDRDSLLVAELVLCALNELQKSKLSRNSTEPSVPAKPSKKQAKQASFSVQNTAASLPFEDHVALFAPPASTLAESVNKVNLAGQVNHGNSQHLPIPEAPFQPLTWKSESLPLNEGGHAVMPLSQPSHDTIDPEAQLHVAMPVTSTDQGQADDEVLQFWQSDLQAKAPEPVQAAPNPQDQESDTAWYAPEAAALDQATISDRTDFSENHSGAVHPIENHEEVMNHQLQPVPGGYAPESMDLQRQSAENWKAEARCAELEHQLASLRQAFADFNGGGFEQQQQAAAETGQQIQDLENRLNQALAELQGQREEQARAEGDLRAEVALAAAARDQSEAGRHEAEARSAQLEQEMAGLQQAQQTLVERLSSVEKAAEAQAAARQPKPSAGAGHGQSGATEGELEDQVRQGVAALAKATAELSKERGERQRSEQRTAELTSRLQALHEDLRRTLQAQGEDLARIGALEEQHRQSSQALEQRTADLEQEKSERHLAEEELSKDKEVIGQLRKDLAFFEETNKKFGGSRQELQARLEASLTAARDSEARVQQESAERQRLAKSLEALRRELQEEGHRREGVELELQAARDALLDREARLEKESSERQRLSDELGSLHRNAHQGTERDLELSKMESALQSEQVERQRQETQLARLRQRARDAAHAARALRANLRRQVREPVENVVQSTHSLLELEMGDEQKRIAESVLQDVLLIQARLREPESASAEANEAAES